jgi:uncharacterized membrane protein required for colicin V production
MLGSLVVILIVLGCIAYQYQKGGLVRGFVLIISSICAITVAFNYYERLAKIIIDRGYIVEWAQPAVFVSLFIVVYAILAILTSKLISRDVKFAKVVEIIGAVVFGACLGLIIAGVLLTVLAMAPLSNKYPYKRFSDSDIKPEKPGKVLLNPDGFVSSIFTSLSTGSFSGKRSFAVLHSDFISQMYLNRLKKDSGLISDEQAIKLPSKEAQWNMTENPADASTGEEVYPATNHNFYVVRTGVTPKLKGAKGGTSFTLSQIRLLCKETAEAKEPLKGSAKSAYPIGYMKMPGKLKTLPLNTEIAISSDDFISEDGKGKLRWLDMVFNVPRGTVPVILQFRQNLLARLPRPLPNEEIPPTASFVPVNKCATETAKVVALSSAWVHGLELAAGSKLLTGLKLPVTNITALQQLESDRAPMEIMLDANRISYLRARLVTENQQRNGRRSSSQQQDTGSSFGEMLKPLPGYRLLSLKCNSPTTGSVITTEYLPALIELSGKVHYPVGVIAGSQSDEQSIYQVDYCGLTSRDIDGGLVIADDGSVAGPFSEIWLTEEVENISELYLLYMVEEAEHPIITSIWLGDEKGEAGFQNYEGFRLQ